MKKWATEINAWNLASSSGMEILLTSGCVRITGRVSQKLYFTPRVLNSVVCPRAQEKVFLTSLQMTVLVHGVPVKTNWSPQKERDVH